MTFTFAKIKGVPIRFHYSWFIAFGVITWSLSTSFFPGASPDLSISHLWLMGAITTLFIFASVLLHEVGHAVHALRGNASVESIDLFIFGGVARLRSEIATPWGEFWFAAAGPMTSLILAAGFSMFNDDVVAGYLARVNIFIGLFNLLPAFPMDGGRILKAILWKMSGDYIWATESASYLGILLSAALMVVGAGFFGIGVAGLGIWLLLIGGFINLASRNYYRQVHGVRGSRWKVADIMVPYARLVCVSPNMPVDGLLGYFRKYGFRYYPVVEGKHCIGLVDYRAVGDSLRTAKTTYDTPVAALMDPVGVVQGLIAPSASIAEALKVILTIGTKSLLVYDGDALVGLLSESGINRSVNQPWKGR